MSDADQTLVYLLDLDGEEIIYEGGYAAKFRAIQIEAIPEKPHGISYSLTFHAPDGRRLMGYDNAHGVVRIPTKSPTDSDMMSPVASDLMSPTIPE